MLGSRTACTRSRTPVSNAAKNRSQKLRFIIGRSPSARIKSGFPSEPRATLEINQAASSTGTPRFASGEVLPKISETIAAFRPEPVSRHRCRPGVGEIECRANGDDADCCCDWSGEPRELLRAPVSPRVQLRPGTGRRLWESTVPEPEPLCMTLEAYQRCRKARPDADWNRFERGSTFRSAGTNRAACT